MSRALVLPSRALRSLRLRKGRFLALPQGSETPLVPYRIDVMTQGAPPFLLPLHRRPKSVADGVDRLLLDASGLLPLTRRFAHVPLGAALRRRDRVEAEAILSGIDAALAAAADLLLPEEGFDLSPGSVFLSYREDAKSEADFSMPRPLDVRLACVPCRPEPGGWADRAELRRWFEAKRLVERRPVEHRPVPCPAAVGRPGPRIALKSALPWIVLTAETLAVAAGLRLEATGTKGFMPALMAILVGVDAGLLLHPASPMALRGKGARRRTAGGAAEKTERLATLGTITRMGVLSENEPGSADEAEGRRWFVLVDEFTVGRDADRVDLVPDGPGVSRMHARIRRLGDAFTIEDLSARNGTFLDDRRLDPGEERILPERCTLRFAGSRYYFRVE